MKLDARAKKLASIVVDYSTDVKKGDAVLIKGETIVSGFMKELARQVIDKGGLPVLKTIYPDLEVYSFNNSEEDQLVRLLNSSVCEAEEMDAYIAVYAKLDPRYLSGVDPEKINKVTKARKKISEIIIGNGKEHKGKKWCVVGYPTSGNAKEAGLTLKEYSDVVFGATNIDWGETSEKMKRVKDAFDNAEEVRIVVPGKTDLKLSLHKRGGQICDGKFNMPDGEVFYGPVEDSAEGYITFSYPAIRDGNLVEGIKLTYQNGEVKEFSAKKNQKFLESMLNLEGAKRLGELGIGCNYGIERYMKNLLFDEKIGGTIHLALGRSYKEELNNGGGLNDSPLHWDIVCELRKTGNEPGGKIYVNGKLVQKNGRWLF